MVQRNILSIFTLCALAVSVRSCSPPAAPACNPDTTCISGLTATEKTTHTSCKCANSPKFTNFVALDQATITAKHNTLRKLQSGSLQDLQWNNDLAQTATRFAAQCTFEHDSGKDRKVPSQPWSGVGQNLYATSASSTNSESAVQSWYDEVEDWTYGMTSVPSGKVVGHFTQVVWNDTLFLGCAAAYCSSGLNSASTMKTILVCNYGPAGNVIPRYPGFPF